MLVSPNEKEYDDLVGIIKGRIEEGNGETIFDVGDTTEGRNRCLSFAKFHHAISIYPHNLFILII